MGQGLYQAGAVLLGHIVVLDTRRDSTFSLVPWWVRNLLTSSHGQGVGQPYEIVDGIRAEERTALFTNEITVGRQQRLRGVGP